MTDLSRHLHHDIMKDESNGLDNIGLNVKPAYKHAFNLHITCCIHLSQQQYQEQQILHLECDVRVENMEVI